MSLQELMRSIVLNASNGDLAIGDANSRVKGGRFSLAAEFALDSSSKLNSVSEVKLKHSSPNLNTSSNEVIIDLQDTVSEAERAQMAKRIQQEREEEARQEELQVLRDQLSVLLEADASAEDSHQSSQNKIKQLELEAAFLNSEADSLEKEILLKRKALELLPMAGDNIILLRTQCAAASAKIMQLAQEWESHRSPLVAEFWEKARRKEARLQRCKQLVDETKRLRVEMVDMIQDLKVLKLLICIMDYLLFCFCNLWSNLYCFRNLRSVVSFYDHCGILYAFTFRVLLW
jgi:hypothetical protein